MNFFKRYRSEIIGALICLTLGTASGYGVKTGDLGWYNELIKPSFTPPAWVFGPVWTLLYVLEGAVLGALWDKRDKRKMALFLFISQFLISLVWPFLFFYYERIDLGLANLIVLWLNLLLFMIVAWRYRGIFVAVLPYSLWVSFALILNLSLFLLNFI